MGTFHAKCKIENPTARSRSVVIPKLLVDTASEFTWVPERVLERIGIRREKKDVRFVLANGQEVTRSVGFAIIRLDKYFTIDEVVFAEPGDLALLGARTLDGLNLTVEPVKRRLVASGPLPAASPHDLSRLRACENSNAASATVIDGAALPGPTGIGPTVFAARYDVVSMQPPRPDWVTLAGCLASKSPSKAVGGIGHGLAYGSTRLGGICHALWNCSIFERKKRKGHLSSCTNRT